jgi:hypothetical protein
MDTIPGARNSTSPASALFWQLVPTEQTAVSREYTEWMLFQAHVIALLRRRHCSPSGIAEQTAVSRGFQVEWMLLKAHGIALLRRRHCSPSSILLSNLHCLGSILIGCYCIKRKE